MNEITNNSNNNSSMWYGSEYDINIGVYKTFSLHYKRIFYWFRSLDTLPPKSLNTIAANRCGIDIDTVSVWYDWLVGCFDAVNTKYIVCFIWPIDITVSNRYLFIIFLGLDQPVFMKQINIWNIVLHIAFIVKKCEISMELHFDRIELKCLMKWRFEWKPPYLNFSL